MSGARGHGGGGGGGCHKKQNSCSTSRKKGKCSGGQPPPKLHQDGCEGMRGGSAGGSGGPSSQCPPNVLRNQISQSFIFGAEGQLQSPQQQQQNNNNLEGGGGGVGGSNGRDVEAEVDRLVDCARQYTEKEKFKLKQFYEEEMVRKKKQVIKEFQCVMEKEVIAPLKVKMCEYEREIEGLRGMLEEERGKGQRMMHMLTKSQQGMVIAAEVERREWGVQSDPEQVKECVPIQQVRNSFVEVKDLEVVDKALDRARKSNRQLQALIQKEKRRKSWRSASLREGGSGAGSSMLRVPQLRSESIREGSVDGEVPFMGGRKESRKKSVTIKGARDSEGNVEEMQMQMQGQEGSGRSRPTSRKGSERSAGGRSERSRSRGGDEDMKEMGFEEDEGMVLELEENVSRGSLQEELRVVESMLANENVSEETKMLVTKVKDLTEALVETRNFTEEEIRDLIRESERMEEYRRRVEGLEEENERLRRRIRELEGMLEGMRRGSEGERERGNLVEENMELMRRLQEMEGMRSKGELKEEMEQLEEELEVVLERNEEAKRRSSSERGGVMPREVEEDIMRREVEEMVRGGEEEEGGGRSRKWSSKRKESGQSRKSGRRSGGTMRSEAEGIGVEMEDGWNDARRVSAESKGLSARSLGEVTGPYQEEIGGLVERIRELDDQLRAMNELEARLREMEEQNREMEGMRGRIGELEGLLEEERAKECPVCPPPDTRELEEKRRRVEELERILDGVKWELEEGKRRLGEMEGVNEELSRSVAGFKLVEQKHSELQGLHAQVLEEKRRRSMEAKMLAGEKGRLEGELEGALREVETKTNLWQRSEQQVMTLEERVRRLEEEMEEMRRKLEQSGGDAEELRRRLREKEAEMEDLRGQVEALRDEARIARRRMEEAVGEKRGLEEQMERERRDWEGMRMELERRLEDERRRCGEACDMLGKKGQCVLEHERRCSKVMEEMEGDNGRLREKLRELEEQLEGNRREMERRAREMQGEMEGFKKRAEGRQRELEELKRIEDTCQLKNGGNSSTSYLPSPVFSLPSLPTPSKMDYQEKRSPPGPSEQCRVVKEQIEELRRQRQGMEGTLEDTMGEVDRLNRQLEELEGRDRKLKEEKERACRDD